jgi:hypothetical protein
MGLMSSGTLGGGSLGDLFRKSTDLLNRQETVDGVSAGSLTVDLLRKGLAKTEVVSKELSDRFEEKRKKADKKYLCLACGKKLNSLSGFKKHATASKGKCAKGYKVIADIKITAEDRRTDSENNDEQNLLRQRREAAIKARDEVYGTRSSNTDSVDVVRLKRAPLGLFETLIARASSEVLKEFSETKDVRYPGKAIIVRRELEKREKK